MPRYDGQNLAAVDPEYRKAHNIGSGGGSNTKRRYAYGKQGNVLVAQGNPLFANGLCLRLLPLYEETAKDDAGNRQFVNFREGRNDSAFGDWARLMTCAHWVGNPGVCFVIHDGNPNISLYESPYHVLRNAAYNNKDNPGIGRLFSELIAKPKVMQSHIGSLTKPEKILFISASVVFVSDDGRATLLGAFSDDQKRNARIIGLKTSAQQALYSALSVQDPSTGEYMSGDMLSFGAAKLVTFLPDSYKTNDRKVMAVGAQGPETFFCPKHAQSNDPNAKYVVGYPQSRSEYTHFAVIHDQYFNHDIKLDAYADKLVAESQSWDEYMWVPTYEEQAEMLATAFPREVLDFAWREHPEYLQALPKNTATFEGAGLAVDELEETHMVPKAPAPAPARQAAPSAHVARPVARPAPAPSPDPVAPWDSPESDLSAEEEAAVADLFSAPAAPVIPPPAMPAQPAPSAAKADSADILAKARARAAGRK